MTEGERSNTLSVRSNEAVYNVCVDFRNVKDWKAKSVELNVEEGRIDAQK